MRFAKLTLFLVWIALVASLTSGSVPQQRLLLPPQPTAAAASPATTAQPPEREDDVPPPTPTTAEPPARAAEPVPPKASAPQPPTQPAGLPRLVVPAIGLEANLAVGSFLNAEGNIEPPLQTAALYDGGSLPGQVGSSLVVAHVSSRAYGPDVFFNLGLLQPGHELTASDGTQSFTYRVADVRVQDKPAFPWHELTSVTDRSVLWLVTCGGTFDYATGHFVGNVIVRAELV